ncbi:hypothetical protein WJX72_009166 [[Myrmecia] bisecta]|uniref:Small ribosomal subunit protein uS5c n=1 Tax=[Myrmecia] bisecta TaxID=41462 RepID=A0AAW1R8A5_9CHLO
MALAGAQCSTAAFSRCEAGPRPAPRLSLGSSKALRGTTLTATSQATCSGRKVATQVVARQGGETERPARTRRGPGNSEEDDNADTSFRGRRDREKEDEFQERVVQVSRVTKVVKGGKQLSFRAVVVVGDEKGQVGVGCGSAKEVIQAVQSAVTDAKRHLIRIPLSRSNSFPHRIDGHFGAAKVMLRPAAEGTGVIAGGAVRVVLELGGIKNGFGKQLGSSNPLNNARATVEGLRNMKTFQQVADERGLTLDQLVGKKRDPEPAAA